MLPANKHKIIIYICIHVGTKKALESNTLETNCKAYHDKRINIKFVTWHNHIVFISIHSRFHISPDPIFLNNQFDMTFIKSL
jgi:hypothetical protein